MDDILKDLNRRFDHALLIPEANESKIRQVCREAVKYNFFSVAVNPVWVKTAHEELAHTPVKILSVAGFPLSAMRSDLKVLEAVKGVDDGAHEIDMVANVGWIVDNRFIAVENEIALIRESLPFNVVLKVIIEAGKLSEQQQIDATKAIVNAGAQFVKTCTGFFGGATVEQVATLYQAAAGRIQVKASGGIKTLTQCEALLKAGATRLGSSSSVAIMEEINALSRT